MANEKALELTKELVANYCYAPLKEAAENWLAAAAEGKEKNVEAAYIAALKDGIIPVDDLIAFCGSDIAKEKFGPEQASAMQAHGEELKATGGKYCDCPACSKALAILELLEK